MKLKQLADAAADWVLSKYPFMLPVAGTLLSASLVVAITLGYV